ncbi:hypothetical protein ACUUL3_05655 [Thiovibrio sp. JS02]
MIERTGVIGTACEFFGSCDFFQATMASVPQLRQKMMDKYCAGGYRDCARHAYATLHGRNSIPEDLFPNAAYF